jgi:hypothetical protein
MRRNKAMIIGLLFLLLGISILVKVFLKIDLPIIRIAFALFLIYLGVKMLFGCFGSGFGPCHFKGHMKTKESVVFGDGRMNMDGKDLNHFSVVFGKGVIDLTTIPKDAKQARAEVNVVFGDAEVLLDPSVPTVIHATGVFAESRMPDDNMVAFGSLNYTNDAAKESGPKLTVHGNVVFGSLKFHNKTDK